MTEKPLQPTSMAVLSQADDDDQSSLRVFFVPYCSASHMIPMVDAARLFARHGGVDVTVVATEANAAVFRAAVDADARAGRRIRIHTLQFPSERVGLPPGVENLQAAAEQWGAVSAGFGLLREPMKRLFRDALPDCLVTDKMFMWTADFAAELGIPRLAFHCGSYFYQCVDRCLGDLSQLEKSSGEDDDVLTTIPGVPGNVALRRSQIQKWLNSQAEFKQMMGSFRDSEKKSYGSLVNSFAELESSYEQHYSREILRTWSIGPTFLAGNDAGDGECYDFGGGEAEEGEIMEWLSSKERSSVLFVGFGSMSKLGREQVAELAHGLEACGHAFVWVLLKEESGCDALPEGFLERVRESGAGLVVKGWAPQRRILRHPAVGGMVTHCGWGSVLEGVAAGLPMLSWPVFGDQFFHQKLVTEVLGIGVGVGVGEWRLHQVGEESGELVARERVASGVAALMGGGEEAEERRRRARRLAGAAEKAGESGGSSHANLVALIDELKCLKNNITANN